jgi:hypothetical protein
MHAKRPVSPGLFCWVNTVLEELMLYINVTKPGDIVSIKTAAGEEIVGKLTSTDNNSYTLNKPVVLAMGQSGATMVPYMLTADPTVHDFTFKDQHVLHCVTTAKTLANQYIQGTTGIVPAGNIQV